ncbi:methyltransferase [Longispora albida]|uniref:methyltransferase n=1 Tax=Longispora albida TaxID=203523 RepID=UPI0003A3FF30|nr:methyltransferase [Longispora albida]
MNEQLGHAVALRRLLYGHLVSRAVCTAAELRLPELLAGGPLSVGELARRCGAAPEPLGRVLRLLEQYGLFSRCPEGYGRTALGAALAEDAPGSARPTAMILGAEFGDSFNALTSTVRHGRAAFDELHGLPLFDYLAKNSEAAGALHASQSSGIALAAADLLDVVETEPGQTIVDVGGGHGSLLEAFLTARTGLSGILYDLPEVTLEAADRLAGLGERCATIGGDFFVSVPEGDLHLLRYVLHDWDEHDALAILRSCRAAMRPGGRLLVVEHVLDLPEADAEHNRVAALFDVYMMLVTTGGRERTLPEFEALLAAADLRLARVVPLPTTGMSLLEAVSA